MDDNSEDKDYDPRKELKKRRIDARTPAGTGRTNRKGRRYLAQKKARSTGPLRMVSATSSGVMLPPVRVSIPAVSARVTTADIMTVLAWLEQKVDLLVQENTKLAADNVAIRHDLVVCT